MPPESSDYASQRCFVEIESDIIELNKNDKYHVLLAGDFNAHVSTVSDLLDLPSDNGDFDDDLLNINNIEFMSNTINSYDLLKRLDIPLTRTSEDKFKLNNHGVALLNFCKSSSKVIFNGRLGCDRNKGNVTNIKANTVIDYIVGNPDLIPFVSNFEILDYNPLLSDLHCPLYLSLARNVIDNDNITNPAPESDNNKQSDNTNITNMPNKNVIIWCQECSVTKKNWNTFLMKAIMEPLYQVQI